MRARSAHYLFKKGTTTAKRTVSDLHEPCLRIGLSIILTEAPGTIKSIQ